jgi:hypothetical protein
LIEGKGGPLAGPKGEGMAVEKLLLQSGSAHSNLVGREDGFWLRLVAPLTIQIAPYDATIPAPINY